MHPLVIPPFLMGLSRNIHATVFNFIAGVIRPMAMLGPSLCSCICSNQWRICPRSRAIFWPDLVPPLSFQRCFSRPFVSHRAIVSFDIGVLLGLSGLDIFDGDATPASPFHQHTTDIFRAVVHADHLWLAAPFYDLFFAAHDTYCSFSMKSAADKLAA